jgi:hypothetical protein
MLEVLISLNFEPLKQAAECIYHRIQPCKAQCLLYVPPGLTFTILRSAHTVYLCVLCRSENKQRLFPNTALTCFLKPGRNVFTSQYKLDIEV